MKAINVLITIALCQCLILMTACSDDDKAVNGSEESTRLYLQDDALSTSPYTGDALTTVYVYGTADWTGTVAGDMTGTECTFGIVMAAPPYKTMTVEVEVIITHDGQETVIASATFTVASTTYERYVESVSCTDPECSDGDQLIVRITKEPAGSGGLGVRANNTAPNDSYVEVPSVELR